MISIQEKCLVQSYSPGGALGPRESAPWIGSAVFAGLTGVTNTQTDSQTGAQITKRVTRVEICRIYDTIRDDTLTWLESRHESA